LAGADETAPDDAAFAPCCFTTADLLSEAFGMTNWASGGGRRKEEEGGRRKEEGGRRKEEGGRRKGGRRDEGRGEGVGRGSQAGNGRLRRDGSGDTDDEEIEECCVLCVERRRDREAGKEGVHRKRRRSAEEGGRETRGWVRDGILSSAETDKGRAETDPTPRTRDKGGHVSASQRRKRTALEQARCRARAGTRRPSQA